MEQSPAERLYSVRRRAMTRIVGTTAVEVAGIVLFTTGTVHDGIGATATGLVMLGGLFEALHSHQQFTAADQELQNLPIK